MHLLKRLKRKSVPPRAVDPTAFAAGSRPASYIDDDATTLAPSIAPTSAAAAAAAAADDDDDARAALLATLKDVIFDTFKTIRRVHDIPREHLRGVAARLEALRDAVEACPAPVPAPTPSFPAVAGTAKAFAAAAEPAPGGGIGIGGGEAWERRLRGALAAAMRECEGCARAERLRGLALVGLNHVYWAKLGARGCAVATWRREPVEEYARVFVAVPLAVAHR
jgi:hypothetical protein